jgi:hypothetical protein
VVGGRRYVLLADLESFLEQADHCANSTAEPDLRRKSVKKKLDHIFGPSDVGFSGRDSATKGANVEFDE